MDTNPLILDLTKTPGNSSAEGISLPVTQDLPSNPFVGLRPFESDESLLFFGRREQTVELLQQLHQTRFLAMVGSSGCGKSSFIRAGLIPKLKAGFLVERRDRWKIATMKPGESPLGNLAHALLNAINAGQTESEVNALVTKMRVNGVQAISERVTPVLKDADTNLLLLVDQFEELFRFGFYTVKERPSNDPGKKEEQSEQVADRERRRDQAADFVSLILGLARQRELPIYVVMTMRSDFLGDCDAFYGLPEAMNRSQYLVPRLTRQQRQEAIENPIRLYGQTIAPRLVDRLLNDVGEESDQLPILQHVLMRTWEDWQKRGGPSLDVPHYEAVGTIKEALSRDADKALEGMSDDDLLITERLFQSLTDTDVQGRRVRRPVHLSEIMAVTGASREKILEIIERFRSDGRSFLSIHDDRHRGDPLIDISHESLIRQWESLRGWVDDEAEAKDIYQRLAIAAYRHKAFDEGLWTGPALQLALDWWEKRQPNEAWARRYHPELILARRSRPDFNEAQDFLEKSRNQREADAAQLKRQQREQLENEHRGRQLARMRRFVTALVAMFLVSLAFAAYAMQKQREASAARLDAEAQAEIARRQTGLVTEGSKRLNAALSNAEAERQRANDEKLKAEEAEKLAEKANEDIKKKNAELVVLQQKTVDQAQAQARAVDQERKQVLGQLGLLYQQAFSLANDFYNGPEITTQKAVDKFKEIHDIYKSAGIQPGMISAARSIADLYKDSIDDDDKPKALPFYQEVLDLSGQGDVEGKTRIHIAMGDILAESVNEKGRLLAISHYEQAVKLGGPKDKDAKAQMLSNLAKSYSVSPVTEDKQKAVKLYLETLSIFLDFSETHIENLSEFEKINARNSLRADAMVSLSTLYHLSGQEAEAKSIFNQQLKFYKQKDDLEEERRLLDNKIDEYMQVENKDAVKYILDMVLRIAQESHDPKEEAEGYVLVAEKCSMLGDVPKALVYLKKALQVYIDQHNPKGEADTYDSLGRIYSRIGQKTEALKYFNMALEIYHNRGDAMDERFTKMYIQSLTEPKEKKP